MSNLDKLKDRNKVIYEKKVKSTNNVPVYGSNGKALSKTSRNPLSSKTKIIAIIISVFIVLIAGFLYIPQFFMQPTPTTTENNEAIITPNENSIAIRTKQLQAKGSQDFDKDGKSNALELKDSSNPFNKNSTNTGFFDGYVDEDKTEENFKKLVNEKFAASSLRILNVVLWPDNDYYKAHCGVVKNANGDYVFDNFKGWVEFMEGKYAYKINSQNEHVLLNKREKENAWYIDEENSVVTVTDKPLKTTNKFTFFGNKSYLSSNFFSDALSFILADYGFISCQKAYLEDTYIQSETPTEVEVQPINYNEFNYERLEKNTNALTDLANVYKTITDKSELLVSIMQEDKGESILEVYGFNDDGSLLIANPNNSKQDVIKVFPHSYRSVDQNGEIAQTEYFDFKGCGFDSTDGKTTICFFKNTRNLS